MPGIGWGNWYWRQLRGINGTVATEVPFVAEVPAVIESPVATEAEIVVKIPDTPAPSTPTQPSTRTPAPVSNTPVYPLNFCDTSSEDVCVYSISPQPTGLIISFKFKNEISNSNIPQLTVASEKFKCELLAGYPGRVFCNGNTIVGDANLILISVADEAIYSGDFTIPKYVVPAPTKKKSNDDNSTYP